MAKQLRTTLKGYFQSGNIPVEQHYVDIIDSTVNLSEVNSGNIDLTGYISSSGITSRHTFGGTSFYSVGDISGSGNISCSAGITSSGINCEGNITASGNVMCNDFNVTGTISSPSATYTTLGTTNFSLGGTNITATGTELNLLDNLTTAEMNQIKTIGTKTISNTQWGYVGAMNQNVTNGSVVQFAGITLSKAQQNAGNYGGTVNTSGQSFTIQLQSCPAIPGRASGIIAKSAPTIILNDSTLITSVILATVASAELSVNAFKVEQDKFEISLGNESNESFGGGNVVINFTIF